HSARASPFGLVLVELALDDIAGTVHEADVGHCLVGRQRHRLGGVHALGSVLHGCGDSDLLLLLFPRGGGVIRRTVGVDRARPECDEAGCCNGSNDGAARSQYTSGLALTDSRKKGHHGLPGRALPASSLPQWCPLTRWAGIGNDRQQFARPLATVVGGGSAGNF